MTAAHWQNSPLPSHRTKKAIRILLLPIKTVLTALSLQGQLAELGLTETGGGHSLSIL